jgi:DUF1680 family protein
MPRRPPILLLCLGALAAPLAAAPPELRCAPFDFKDVQLLDGPFRDAMERNGAYLLSLEPDRLLHNAREYAGLPPKAPRYGGWESTGVGGHILGHLLTAAAQMYAVTGDARYRQRIDYLVGELALCQKAYGDGYVGALPPLELATLRGFGRGIVSLRDPESFTGGAWAPWYTEHKILNGLKDAWILAGNTQARDVARRLADWIGAMTAGLTPRQLQEILGVEQGGIVDTLAELSALTGEPRYLETARRFRHEAVLGPLRAGRDQLALLHANTNIPKITGEARLYEVAGDPDSRAIAEFFWATVVHHHTYVIGGNSDDEHFFHEEKTPKHFDACTAETCNTYNMLKLTEHLLGWDPRVEYADFYERALYNHILASQDPRRGMFTYFMSLEPGLFRTYSTPYDSFWCCVGTGLENHTRYGRAIYFHGTDDLIVNLFIPSQVTWPENGFALEQETDYPRTGQVRLTVRAAPKVPVTLRVRCPGWAAAPVQFAINGRPVPGVGQPGTYAALNYLWRKGDRVTFTIPLAVRTEPMVGAPDQVAFLYGPAVLAGDLGPEPATADIPYSHNQRANLEAAPVPVPVLARVGGPLESVLRRIPGRELAFEAAVAGSAGPIVFRPFWVLNFDRYSVYWKVARGAAGSGAPAPPATAGE